MRFLVPLLTVIISVNVFMFAPTLATPSTPARLQRRNWYPFLRGLVDWKDCLQRRLDLFIELEGVSNADRIIGQSLHQKLVTLCLLWAHHESWFSAADGITTADFVEYCIEREPPECCGLGPKGGPSVKMELNEKYQLEITQLAGQVFQSISHQVKQTWRRWGSSAAVSVFLTAFASRVAPIAARALTAA